MPQDFTWDDANASAPKAAPPSGSFNWEDDDRSHPALSRSEQLRDPAAKAAFDAKQATPTQYEQQNTPQGSAWSRLGSGIASGAEAMNPFAGASSMGDVAHRAMDVASGMNPMTSIPRMDVDAIRSYRNARSSGQGVIPSLGAAAAGPLGLDAPGIAERAGRGDYAGVAGEMIPPIAAAFLPEGKKQGAALREGIGGAIHTPEGELTPMGHVAGTALAGGAGALLGKGIPGIGELAGALLGKDAGPGAIQKLFPEPEAARAARVARNAPPPVPELGSPENPGWNVKLPDRMPEVKPELGSPENPGWVVKIPDRMPSAAAAEATPGESYSASPMKRMGQLIEKGAGAPPGGIPALDPNVPLRDQPGNFGGKPTFRREPLTSRVGQLEEGAGRNVAPEKIPQLVSNEVGQQMGAAPTAKEAETARLQQKYSDRAERQLVHINGEEIHEAAKGDPETYQQLTKLTNPDMRQAAINAGMKMVRDDGSPIMVNNRMLSGDIPRQQVFKELLHRGYSPAKILDLARQPMEESKPGPQRAWRDMRESKAGD
jgi:hypothetical protein